MTEPKPNPPKFPFVILDESGEPTRTASGKIAGYRNKTTAAEAIISKGISNAKLDRRELSDDIEIEGEQ